jgi:Protein of unknown function (DUF2599)
MSNYYTNLITTSLIVFSLITGTITATAEDKSLRVDTRPKDEISKLLKNIEKQDPQQLKSQKLERKNQNDQTKLEAKNGDLNIDFDLKTKSVNVKNSKKGNSQIGIPNSSDINSVDVVENKVIYKNSKNKVDTIVEAVDGGVRMIVNIPDSNAPSSYDFPIELQANEKLILNEDGSAAVTRPMTKEEKDRIPKKDLPEGLKIPEYSTKLFIVKPWAKDANGKELKTSYSVKGNILTQNIDLAGAVFPVVADPIWCGNAIAGTNWFWNTGGQSSTYPNEVGWTLSVYPNWCGVSQAFSNWFNTYWDAWVDVCNSSGTGGWCGYWSSDEYYSMFYQFVCHYNQIGALKRLIDGSSETAWNLDEWRPNVGWVSTVLNRCNPKKV